MMTFCDMCEEISLEEPHYVKAREELNEIARKYECDIECLMCGKVWKCDE